MTNSEEFLAHLGIFGVVLLVCGIIYALIYNVGKLALFLWYGY
jgi:hypothetical protein